MDIELMYDNLLAEINESHLEESNDLSQGQLFLHNVTSLLIESEELDDFSPISPYRHERLGLQVSGFYLRTDSEQLDLFIVDYCPEKTIQSIPPAESKKLLNRVDKFFKRSLQGKHIEQLEPSSEAFDLAHLIYENKETLCEVRFFLITNRECKVDTVEENEEGDIKTFRHICDINKIHRILSSGAERENIAIDFKSEFGSGIPCLKMPYDENDFCTYMAMIPGDLLAAIYNNYGSRLLEKNVRSFLQLKGKVNKDMRKTIQDEPNLFLAYNNGLTVTVKGIETENENGTLIVTKVDDFQIVNGGQTTACIYHTFKKDKADLSRLVVQAKITQIKNSEITDDLTQAIARYANSQNKVNDADLSSNNSYLVGLEALSQTIWAPAAKGSLKQTKWYFDRARNQYETEQNRQGTPARIKKWKELHPKRQKITKTDFAKFENSWRQNPSTVSRGAQFNFLAHIQDLKNEEKTTPNETDFKHLAAKAILFKKADQIIRQQQYGDFKAQNVTYTIAFLSYKTDFRVNMDRIWLEQDLSPALEEEIKRISELFFSYLMEIAKRGTNVTQYCKKLECWDIFRDRYPQYRVGYELQEELLRGKAISKKRKSTVSDEELVVVENIVNNKKMFTKLKRWHGCSTVFDEDQQKELKDICDSLRYDKTVSYELALSGRKLLEIAMNKGFIP